MGHRVSVGPAGIDVVVVIEVPLVGRSGMAPVSVLTVLDATVLGVFGRLELLEVVVVADVDGGIALDVVLVWISVDGEAEVAGG